MRDKNILKEEFKNISKKICLSSDLWTSYTQIRIISLIAPHEHVLK